MTKSICKPQYGSTNPNPEELESMSVRRFGSVIGLNSEKEQYYRELHANVWSTIIACIRKANIRNYSIYVTEIKGRKYLFSYLEYVGHDFEADMKGMADNYEVQRWWKETDPCQFSIDSRKPDTEWSGMEMVFMTE